MRRVQGDFVIEKVVIFLTPVDSGNERCRIRKIRHGNLVQPNVIRAVLPGLFWWMAAVCLGFMIACCRLSSTAECCSGAEVG